MKTQKTIPDSQSILHSLQSITNNYNWIAILWHALALIFFILLIFKDLATNRMTGILISLPLISVAVLAWITGNPFNGFVFSVLGILTFIFGLSAPDTTVQTSRLIFLILGVLMIIFGWIYPHFLEIGSRFKYLYKSPLGLIPCPTLSFVIGITLVFGGLNSQALVLTLLVGGFFYGLFEIFRLGVVLDSILLLGTVTLLVQYILLLRG